MSDAIPGETVRAAYGSAPLPIRDVFNSEKISRIVLDMRSRYQLHVDVAGILGREIGYLLLGLVSPMEFLGRLVDAGVDGNTAKHIASDINEQIFMPLQKVMKEPGSYVPAAETPTPSVPVPEAISTTAPQAEHRPSPAVSVPELDYVAPARQTLPGSPAPAPMPFPNPTTPTPATFSAEHSFLERPGSSNEVLQTTPPTQPSAEGGIVPPLKKDYAEDPYREPV